MIRSTSLHVALNILKAKYSKSLTVAIESVNLKMMAVKKEYVFNNIPTPGDKQIENLELLKILFTDIGNNSEYEKVLKAAKNLRLKYLSRSRFITDDEIICLIHGFYYFSRQPSYHVLVHNIILYGFFLVRNDGWMKNKRNQLFEPFKTQSFSKLKSLLNLARV